jgi:ABC-2 type transport system permease protein
MLVFYVVALGADFGNQWGLLVLTLLVASFASVAFGMLFSMVVPGSVDKIGGYLSAVVYTFAIAAGLINSDIRNMVRDSVPLLDRVNIVAIISDTFLALVIHDDLSRYIQQLMILLGIAVVSTIIGATALRRKSYVDL